MNRMSIAAMTMLAVFALAPIKAEAQFFKKLGKAVNKVLDTPSSSKKSSGQTKTVGNVKIVNKLPGFEVDYKGVTWQKDFCGVEITVTNTGDETVRVYDFNKMKTFDSDGNEYASRSIVGKNLTTVGNGDFDFEPGVPVKCIYALFDLPENGTTMSLLQLRTRTHEGANGYVDRYIELRNVPIPARQQAATAGAKPFKGVWTATGNGYEAKAELDLYGMTIDGTDADYNDIKCYGMIHVGFGDRVDDCSITACKPNGNKAGITFTSSRDGHIYTATLTVDPAKNTLTVSDVTLTGDEEFSDCYVNDGLVLKQK